MRDNRYKALHRGGPLSLAHHRLLAVWAAACAEHVLALFTAQRPTDNRPQQAIDTARAWARGEYSVGEARAASVATHALLRVQRVMRSRRRIWLIMHRGRRCMRYGR